MWQKKLADVLTHYNLNESAVGWAAAFGIAGVACGAGLLWWQRRQNAAQDESVAAAAAPTGTTAEAGEPRVILALSAITNAVLSVPIMNLGASTLGMALGFVAFATLPLLRRRAPRCRGCSRVRPTRRARMCS